MTDQDNELTTLVQDIINKALKGDSHPFRPILYWSEFMYYRGWIRATKLVIRTLKTSADKVFKDYCKDVIAGISDITKILAYRQLLDIAAFYENDLNTVQQMLNDYDEYLGNFRNFVGALFGERREL